MEINRTNYRDYSSSVNVFKQSNIKENADNKSSVTDQNKPKDIDIHNATFDEFK